MQNLNVNITPDNYPQSLYYSQNDVGREFKINITDFTIPVGATVKIQATKPSGFGFSVAGAVSGNSVTFETTDEMTDEAGRFPAELVIESGAVVIGTANFLMVGEMNPHPEGTTDGSQGTIIPELTLLVERVEAAASSVLDMQVVAQTLPAGSQASYSYDEDLNKATFGIPEGQAGAGAAGVVASAYSAAKTYKVGDYVLYNSNLYRCTTAITTAEAWTAAHWTQVVLADDVTDLKTDLNNVVSVGNAFVTTSAKKGYYDISAVWHSSSGICCTLDWLIADYDFTITFPVGYRIAVLKYGESGHSSDGWKTTPYPITKGTKFMVNFSTVNQDNITDANEFVKVYLKTTYLTDLANKIETNRAEVLNKQYQTVALSQTGAYPVTEDVELGRYDGSGNKLSDSSKVRSKGLISYPYDITITSIKPYRFSLLIKNSDSYTSTGWVYTYTVSANAEFLFVCEDNTGNPVSDVHEFITHYPIGSYAQTNVNAIKKKADRINQLFVTPRFEGVAHRGFSSEAPQSSVYSFALAKKKGFNWVETDLHWTSDNVPILIHDSSINSIARNLDGTEISSTINVENTTYEDLMDYDYNVVGGTPKEEYSGNKLLTLEEALIIWKKLGLKAVVEIKSGQKATDTNIGNAIALIQKYGFEDDIIIASYYAYYLNKAVPFLNRPRLLRNVDSVGTEDWTATTTELLNYKAQGCEVYLALLYTAINDTAVTWASSNGVPMLAFTIDTESAILDIDPYVTYIVSNTLNATEVFEKEMFDLLPSEN